MTTLLGYAVAVTTASRVALFFTCFLSHLSNQSYNRYPITTHNRCPIAGQPHAPPC